MEITHRWLGDWRWVRFQNARLCKGFPTVVCEWVRFQNARLCKGFPTVVGSHREVIERWRYGRRKKNHHRSIGIRRRRGWGWGFLAGAGEGFDGGGEGSSTGGW
ncbi:hypothetical protein Salat_2109200 [Sesamum alatum]|uniref:Uncharacterized protein n=1 Tax=Sesamum alatum TaxID=300844 RepID=A0AAE1Y0M3_9LAMI|nr:hypothetical protein Salat_2109200 [Sesamum alatum]